MTQPTPEFAPLKNDRFLRALLRQPVDRTPVWMMRQAGRYLPEYRATRAQAGDFMSLCQNPELACEVTLQPLRRYSFDAAILFSDILTIPDAFGQGLYFETGEGPKFKKVIRTPADVEALPDVSIADELSYVTDAVSVIRRELNGSVPLIGFSGSPWTLATYMIEGGGSKDFRRAKQFLYNHPEAMHLLLDKLAQAVIDYLNGQIAAGAQAVQIFDTWGGVLTPTAYQEFSLAYMKKIVAGLTRESEGREVPVILFTKNGGQWLESLAAAGADADEVAEDIAAMRGVAESVLEDASTGPEVLAQGDGPHVLAWRDWVDPADVVTDADCFEDHGVLDAIDAARGDLVTLGPQASMFIEPTRALVAVDVNTGADGSFAAGLKANMACARALPAALRVRGLGGQVVLDLAPMPKKERRSFEGALRAAFRTDDVDTVLAGWTPLGHYELQRKRARLPLSEVLA